MGTIAVAHVPQQRQDDGHQDALLDADRDDGRCGENRQLELPRAFTANIAQPPHIDHPDRDREHDGGEHAARQVLQWAGEEEQHQQHDAGEDELRDLAARAGAFRHRGLGGTAVDHKGPAHRGRRVGGR